LATIRYSLFLYQPRRNVSCIIEKKLNTYKVKEISAINCRKGKKDVIIIGVTSAGYSLAEDAG